MTKHRILLVDDNEAIRAVFKEGLETRGFEVVPASTVNEALRLISAEKFDALLSDLHMPNAGDGLTVVSAMRHAHPEAITIVQSGYPAMPEALSAILLQADEVLTKPLGLGEVAEMIQKRLANPKPRMAMNKQQVTEILDRETDTTIQHWMSLVDANDELATVVLLPLQRTGHLRLLLGDIVRRLRLPPTATALTSTAAREHGILRRMQGYSVAMMVEESRMLQVSVFRTLQLNLAIVDFSTVLLDVMAIADEIDSQLKQAVLGFMTPQSAMAANASRSLN